MILNSLVDSGSSNSFIDLAFVKPDTFQLTAYHLFRLRLIDGTSNSIFFLAGPDLQLCFPTGESQKLTLFVTPLDQSCMIVLGYRWLTHYNPWFDWVLARSLSTISTTQILSSPPSRRFCLPAPTSKPPDPVWRLWTHSPVETLKNTESYPHHAAPAYSRTSMLEGSKNFSTSISHPEVTGQTMTTMEKKVDMDNFPKEYHNFTDVFQQIQAGQISWTPTIWSQDQFGRRHCPSFVLSTLCPRRNLQLCIVIAREPWPPGLSSLTLPPWAPVLLSKKRFTMALRRF